MRSNWTIKVDNVNRHLDHAVANQRILRQTWMWGSASPPRDKALARSHRNAAAHQTGTVLKALMAEQGTTNRDNPPSDSCVTCSSSRSITFQACLFVFYLSSLFQLLFSVWLICVQLNIRVGWCLQCVCVCVLLAQHIRCFALGVHCASHSPDHTPSMSSDSRESAESHHVSSHALAPAQQAAPRTPQQQGSLQIFHDL